MSGLDPPAGPKPLRRGEGPAIHQSQMTYWVYILASKPGGTLYVGVTNDPARLRAPRRPGRKLHQALRHQDARLFRSARNDRGGASAREEPQALVARVEGRPYRRRQSGLAGFV